MVSFDDLKAIAEKEEAEEIHPDEAMRRLGSLFKRLKDPDQIKDGKAFMEELKRIFWEIGEGMIDGEQISVHTIFGICQLVHRYRDRKGISPSRKKSFQKIIPWLLARRSKIKKKPSKDIVQYMNQKFGDLHREEFGW